MRIYIKGDYAKKITFTTRELVWKMWFKERNGKKISYSNVGDDEMLQDDFYFGAELRNLNMPLFPTTAKKGSFFELPQLM